METNLYIGTSGWHYNHWYKTFYPVNIKGYYELKYHAKFFNSVENNSSFYRIASENTYKTWVKMTPNNYKFSIKLNKSITHISRLQLDEDVKTKINEILSSTQILEYKLGAIVIQLPASFKFDLAKFEKFLKYFHSEVKKKKYKFDIAVEFRNKYWFNDSTYEILKKYNSALVAADSSRYPGKRELTTDFAYLRLHGPKKLFASSYEDLELEEIRDYIVNISERVKKIYVYFNNDFEGFAIKNALQLKNLVEPYLK